MTWQSSNNIIRAFALLTITVDRERLQYVSARHDLHNLPDPPLAILRLRFFLPRTTSIGTVISRYHSVQAWPRSVNLNANPLQVILRYVVDVSTTLVSVLVMPFSLTAGVMLVRVLVLRRYNCYRKLPRTDATVSADIVPADDFELEAIESVSRDMDASTEVGFLVPVTVRIIW